MLSPNATSPGVHEFRSGMSLLPGGVNVVTTSGDAGLAGFTASAVCSVTDSPPTVLVCMNRGSNAYPHFSRSRVACVSVLSGEQQHLSTLFSNRDVPMSQRFEQCAWTSLETGAPALDGALANLDGDIIASHDVGTHSIFIVQLRKIRVGSQDAPGLAYFKRGYHVLTDDPRPSLAAAA